MIAPSTSLKGAVESTRSLSVATFSSSGAADLAPARETLLSEGALPRMVGGGFRRGRTPDSHIEATLAEAWVR